MGVVSLLSILALFSYRSLAQSIASCTVSLQNWTTNDEGQSPCQVGTSLLNACTPQVPTRPLTQFTGNSNSYIPPLSTFANLCTCSSVTYAMVSACAVCQGGIPGPWSQAGNNSWIANCPANMISLSSYPNQVPPNTHIPVWAFQDVSSAPASTFDIVAAEQLSEQHQPDVTSGVDPLTTTSTGTGTSSLSSPTSSSRSSPAPSSTTSPSSSTHKSSHGGVIAGAVIGSLAGVACVLLAIYFYIRYRRQKKPRRYFEGNYEKNASMLNVDGQSAVVPAVSYPPLKLYDPSDPSTFPPAAPVPASPTLVGAGTLTHSRNNSDEPNLIRTPPSHSRQPSDTVSIQPSLNSTISATPGRNPNSGYNPSGIAYRTIAE